VPDAASLAIIIVSYNVRDELDGCLRSVVGRADPFATEVVVVDNGSHDGTVKMVRERWPAVRVIEAPGNVGFSRANNLGIRATASDFVLLLNPDTVVQPSAIQTLMRTLGSRHDAAAVGPRLVDGDGIPELSFGWRIGPLGELRQKIVGGLHRRGVGPVRRLVDRWTRAAGTREWVSGACLLIRRTDLASAGLLDERYFMYTEDVDLCVSLRRRGRAILFVPDAEVIHLRGRSAGRNPQTERLRRVSQLAYYAKHHPSWLPLLRAYLRVSGKLPQGDR
jgi:GT2 family glycosyltransferase